jgi:hypothetical protein
VDATISELRLAEIAFDAVMLRVVAEADGNASVTVTSLPQTAGGRQRTDDRR